MFIVGLIANVIYVILNLIVFVVIAQVIASWLVAFGVINMRNRFVYTIVDVLNRTTDPILKPIRRFIPSFGGLDISPLILILVIEYLIQPLLLHYLIAGYQ